MLIFGILPFGDLGSLEWQQQVAAKWWSEHWRLNDTAMVKGVRWIWYGYKVRGVCHMSVVADWKWLPELAHRFRFICVCTRTGHYRLNPLSRSMYFSCYSYVSWYIKCSGKCRNSTLSQFLIYKLNTGYSIAIQQCLCASWFKTSHTID